MFILVKSTQQTENHEDSSNCFQSNLREQEVLKKNTNIEGPNDTENITQGEIYANVTQGVIHEKVTQCEFILV